MEAIIEFGSRSNTELMKDTGLSKDTIIEYTKRMKNNGLINKTGKKGKWYLTNDAYQYPKLRATLFRKKAMTKILKDNFPIEKKLNFLSKNCKNNPIINRNSEGDHHPRQQQDIIVQQQLSRFASKVGCYIIYCFIKASEPNIWRPKIDITEIEFMLGRDKDKVIKNWIENSIDISEIFREFCNLKIVKQGLARGIPNQPPSFNKIVKLVEQSSKIKDNEVSKSQINELAKNIHYQYKKIYEQNSKRKLNPEDPAWSLNELDKNTYDDLVKNLKNVYPNVVEELEKIKEELNDDIKREISFICDPEHTLCKGKIELVKVQTLFQDTIIKRQCNECKRFFPDETENK
jgi:hypothetical protein